jgi:hypothetical protein
MRTFAGVTITLVKCEYFTKQKDGIHKIVIYFITLLLFMLLCITMNFTKFHNFLKHNQERYKLSMSICVN